MCNTFQMANKMEVNKLAAARMRARYLLDRVDTYLDDGGDLALHWAREELDECISLFTSAAYTFKSDNETTKSWITDEMIEQARSYPIDKLIEFIRGKAKAFCHEDKNPSAYFATRKNRLNCPVCDRSFSPIDVLIHRDGYVWKDAVQHLCQL